MKTNDTILVTGGDNFIGSAIIQALRDQGYDKVLSGEVEPDWTDQVETESFFAAHLPAYVFHAAGKTAGIMGNQRYPADLMYNNLMSGANVIHTAFKSGVKRLLYVASSCCYPKHCKQPMIPSSLLTGSLEPTNEAYAIAKIAGLKLCSHYSRQYGAPFVSAIPANPFGPGEDFDSQDSHVIPALLKRFHEAKEHDASTVTIWGTGRPRREFIFSEDLADACIFAMIHYEGKDPINLAGGSTVSIQKLAEMIQCVVGYEGQIHFDESKPDGMPVKELDNSQLQDLGWSPLTGFLDALTKTYACYLSSLQGT